MPTELQREVQPPVLHIAGAGVSPPAGASKDWTDVLLPSLSDLFFLFITVWAFLSSPIGWQRLLKDADTTLHIRIGQQILSSGSIPSIDAFSFSKPGGAWFAFEWLSEVIFAAAYNLTG